MLRPLFRKAAFVFFFTLGTFLGAFWGMPLRVRTGSEDVDIEGADSSASEDN